MTKIDNEALAEAYNRALDLEKAGKFDEAAEAYKQVLELDPEDHGGVVVRLASMGKGQAPSKAPDAYVSTLFDQHAEVFDMVLVDQLGYSVPLMVRDRIEKLELGPFKRLLDLGCGTGLSGAALHDFVPHKTGVDIAEGMVEIADEKEIYDDLYVGEVVEFLKVDEDERWDLIVATDVLPYMGELEEFFAGVASNIAQKGVFAFSSETQPADVLGTQQFAVGKYHRFAHAESYIRDLLAKNNFSVLDLSPITVRSEQGEPVPGHLVIATFDKD
ncbi:Trans-aconitate 2-methyltransferase [Pseudovibrio axinellae]|uniref:Trans-aconitate 2-methyltransferase n=1 Tax=Pseudovibrio axinellae TaxID=989403 RepID=A0A165YTW3_9HYPH|nr:methyltransferase [Pseudovibrio axinellae]KZL19232.1 Trans-aconitate 2-methyltransferase [Pseudovibrio axinellae]SEQ44950.1 Predicted methyltransferase, contains TPR repeat [Pseudovibrio axinellae]